MRLTKLAFAPLMLALSFTAAPAFAVDACETTLWSEAKAQFRTCLDSTTDAVVSSTCLQDRNCWALQSLKLARTVKPDKKSETWQIHEGSRVCTFIGGRILILTQESGDQAAFCKGPDSTLVDLNSLRDAFLSASKR